MPTLQEIEKRLPRLDDSWKQALRQMAIEVRRVKAIAKDKGFDISRELGELADAVGQRSEQPHLTTRA